MVIFMKDTLTPLGHWHLIQTWMMVMMEMMKEIHLHICLQLADLQEEILLVTLKVVVTQVVVLQVADLWVVVLAGEIQLLMTMFHLRSFCKLFLILLNLLKL
jgi:hypothetical protein